MLISGSLQRGPDQLITDDILPLVGDYVFNGIPVTLNPDSATFKMVVTKDGYQPFEAAVQLNTDLVVGRIPEQEFIGSPVPVEDTAYNFIGNIYLFPLGEQAGDITVIAERDGERIKDVTVHLQQNPNNNQATVRTSARLAPMAGVYPNLFSTTDNDGRATFPGRDLVLGGAYTPVIRPLMYEGTQLRLQILEQLIVGSNDAVLVANLLDLEPGDNSEGLYIVFASNQDSGDVSSNGTLNIVFNRPVAIVGEQGFQATLSDGCTQALLAPGKPTPVSRQRTPTTAAATPPEIGQEVSAQVSADGFTLTLTPRFHTALTSEDIDCDIRYRGGRLSVQGDDLNNAYGVFSQLTLPDGRTTLNGLYLGDGSNSTIVHLTGPQFAVHPRTLRLRATPVPTRVGGLEGELAQMGFSGDEIQVLTSRGLSLSDAQLILSILNRGFSHPEIVEIAESRISIADVASALDGGMSREEILRAVR